VGTVRISFLTLLGALLVVTGAAGEGLRVGTSGDYPPFSARGQGFDVEVAERLASDLGRPIEWVPFRWPELSRRVRAGDFDIVMSGVTWRDERAVAGWMTRAVAAGGPCVVGAEDAVRIAVNRGGFLERWTRARFPQARILPVDDNLALAEPLARGEVEAFVTDSFELPHLPGAGRTVRCEPPAQRKVYWVAPPVAAEIGPRIDAWLAENEPALQRLRERWLGAPMPRDEIDHLIDLLARRLALMPAVAAWKRAHGIALEDAGREALVLERATAAAHTSGLDAEGARTLFRAQIELAKAVQARSPQAAPELDLQDELRPALLRLGERIVASLAGVIPLEASDLAEVRWVPLRPLLREEEIERLRAALLGVRRGE
jgi:chorismate mutase-like protein